MKHGTPHPQINTIKTAMCCVYWSDQFMIPFMVSIYGVFQGLFIVLSSNGTGHITMAQPKPNTETAFSTRNEQKQNPQIKNSQTEQSMAPPLTTFQENRCLNIILTIVLTYTFHVMWNTRFCATEISILKENAFCDPFMCCTKQV
jgi:hypothetical protein